MQSREFDPWLWRDILREHQYRFPGRDRFGRDRPDDAQLPALHAVVLAGGQGRRLAGLTERVTGGSMPKQYCAFRDGRSPLQETLRRLDGWIPRKRIVTVINRAHGAHAAAQLQDFRDVEVFDQAHDCGTGVALLAPLVELLIADPDAYVLVTPADHGVVNEGVLRESLAAGLQAAVDHERIVTFGIDGGVADAAAGALVPYGPAQPGGAVAPLARLVAAPLSPSQRALPPGGLIDTQLLVAPGKSLFGLYAKLYPRLTRLFLFWASMPVAERNRYLDLACRGLAPLDLQTDLLSFAHDAAVYCLPAEVGLTDLDTERSVIAWLVADANAAVGEPAVVGLSTPSDRPYRRVAPPAPQSLFVYSGPPAEA